MRVVAAISYIVLAICSLGIHGDVQAYPHINFDVAGDHPITRYRLFIWELREIVSVGTDTIHGLPVLRDASVVPDGERFVLAGLSNGTGYTVTLAIDVVNLYVVAFTGVHNKSYFFKDATELQLKNLFVSTDQTRLGFNSSYITLEKLSGVSRTEIPLGPTRLADAIAGLWYGEGAPEPLLVVIQMVSDAARFNYIKEQVVGSITGGNTFTPKGLIVSMEDEWGSMSNEVLNTKGRENFTNPVRLLDDNNQALIINNFTALSRYTGIAILLGNYTTSSSYSNIALAEDFVNNELLKL